jgi:hypothetical protein
MKQQEEVVVLTKIYDLILWSCNHTSRLPCQHRFVLGERLERNLYDLLETLIRANVNEPHCWSRVGSKCCAP